MNGMIKNAESGEHILVCLSPSPSNPKVIAAAAKMAEAFRATLTAIYIRPTDYVSLSDLLSRTVHQLLQSLVTISRHRFPNMPIFPV